MLLLIGPAPWLPPFPAIYGPSFLGGLAFFIFMIGTGLGLAFVFVPAIQLITTLARDGHRARHRGSEKGFAADWVAGLFCTALNVGGATGPVVSVYIYDRY